MAHFESIREDDNWATNNAGFQLLMVDDIGSVTIKAVLFMIAGSLAGTLDAVQLSLAVSLVIWGLHCTFRYFRDVFPHRHRVHDPDHPHNVQEARKRM